MNEVEERVMGQITGVLQVTVNEFDFYSKYNQKLLEGFMQGFNVWCNLTLSKTDRQEGPRWKQGDGQEAITSERGWCLRLVCGSGDNVQWSDLRCIWRR